ncbi:MAG: hypothetical protein IKR73_04000 [Oscillospiraceae bacterium]|nr:hypothetical protein [Oscillospiraceae bacterium]
MDIKRILAAAVMLLVGCAPASQAAAPREDVDRTEMDDAAVTLSETTSAAVSEDTASVTEETTVQETTSQETREQETARETTAETEAPVTERTAVSTMQELLPEYEPVAEDAGNVLTDISLRADKRELMVGEGSAEVIWYAELPVRSEPETVGLVDADTGEAAAVLCDIADYERYGGDIMGDGVYNCRFTVDTDIDTDKDVSEDKTYRYYAEFSDEEGVHRSEIFEIKVYEPFTDKELGDMQAVKEAVRGLMEDKTFRALDTDAKREQMMALLDGLATEGTKERPYPLIHEEIWTDGKDMISYTHLCGVSSGIKLEPFDPMMN